MSAPEPDELERRLTQLFQQRAATVTQGRPLDLSPVGSPSGSSAGGNRVGPAPDHQRRHGLGVLAAAAAVFVAIAATIVAIQAGRHQPGVPPGKPTATATNTPPGDQCLVAAPASWQQAIQSGALPAEPAPTTAISVNGGTGDYLVVRVDQPGRFTLGVFNGGLGRTFYATDSASGYPQVDRTGATSAGFVTFALLKHQGAKDYSEVMLYNRATQQTRVLAGWQPPEDLVRRVSSNPVIAAGKVYWLDTYDGRPETTMLQSWDLARDTAGEPVPAANATGLVGYGSGVALVRSTGSGSILGNGAGTPLAKAQLTAAAGGDSFGFDGVDRLSWLRYDDQNRPSYAYLVVGGGAVGGGQPMRHAPGIAVLIYPFADVDLTDAEVSNNSLLDLRTGAAVRLPAGVRMQAVVGDKVIFGLGTTETGAAALSLVPVSALPAVGC